MKEKKYTLYGIGIVLISLIGISLAYFATQIVGKEKNISVNTKDLKIIFNNGDAITGENVVAEDNWSMTKTFSVENKSNSTYKYNIVIKDLINTFKTTGYLQYKITSTDGGYNMTSFEDVPKRSSITDTVLAYNISIDEGTTQNYTITIQYPNDANIDQSDDMGATLSGKLYISEGSYPTLAQLILRDNPTISERTDFSVTNTANTTGTIYQTNKTEDGSTVYYYSGNTTNNWVKFGKETIQECTYDGNQVNYGIYNEETSDFKEIRKVASSDECVSTNVCSNTYNGPIIGLTEEECGKVGTWTTDKATASNKTEKDIYWRIIRTNEDGSVRFLYSGNSHDTTMGYIGLSAFNESNNDPMYVGYKYGTSGSLANNRTNTNDSTIKTVIDTWYKKTLLTNYDKYISKTAIYCNDRSIASDQTYSTSSAFNYGPYTRLVDNKTPTYKCGGDTSNGLFESTQAVADKFSASTASGGNGQLKYPVAMMTADESAFIGGTYMEILSNPFSWYYTNSASSSITGRNKWWLLSPHSLYFDDSFLDIPPLTTRIFLITGRSSAISDHGKGGIVSDGYDISYTNAIRPVLSLSSCVKVTGRGTPDDPYAVDYENSCN